MPTLCPLKEQTGRTNSHGIISQQYNKLSGMASHCILSTLELAVFGIANMKLENYKFPYWKLKLYQSENDPHASFNWFHLIQIATISNLLKHAVQIQCTGWMCGEVSPLPPFPLFFFPLPTLLFSLSFSFPLPHPSFSLTFKIYFSISKFVIVTL